MRYSRNVRFFCKGIFAVWSCHSVTGKVKVSSVDRTSLFRPFPRPRHPLTRPVHWVLNWSSSWSENPYPALYCLSLPDTEDKRETYLLYLASVWSQKDVDSQFHQNCVSVKSYKNRWMCSVAAGHCFNGQWTHLKRDINLLVKHKFYTYRIKCSGWK